MLLVSPIASGEMVFFLWMPSWLLILLWKNCWFDPDWVSILLYLRTSGVGNYYSVFEWSGVWLLSLLWLFERNEEFVAFQRYSSEGGSRRNSYGSWAGMDSGPFKKGWSRIWSSVSLLWGFVTSIDCIRSLARSEISMLLGNLNLFSLILMYIYLISSCSKGGLPTRN